MFLGWWKTIQAMAILGNLDQICFRQSRTNERKSAHDNGRRTIHDNSRAINKDFDISEEKTKDVYRLLQQSWHNSHFKVGDTKRSGFNTRTLERDKPRCGTNYHSYEYTHFFNLFIPLGPDYCRKNPVIWLCNLSCKKLLHDTKKIIRQKCVFGHS